MSVMFASLASGSSGNSYVIKTEKTCLIVDAGISGRKIIDRLGELGIGPEEVKLILITHEHIDHVRSIGVLAKKLPNADICSSRGTYPDISHKVPCDRFFEVSSGDVLVSEDIKISVFALSHDAREAVGYSFREENTGRQISIVTDTGIVTDEIHETVKDSDLLVLEANHDKEMLRFGSYPYQVKLRILGDRGHLSNEACAEELARICREVPKYRQVLLAHLSKENNFPEMAYQTVKNALADEGILIGRELSVGIVPRDGLSEVFKL